MALRNNRLSEATPASWFTEKVLLIPGISSEHLPSLAHLLLLSLCNPESWILH